MKTVLSKLTNYLTLFRYILNIPISEVSNIFKSDVNSDLLVQILKVFHAVITDRIEMNEELKAEIDPSEAEGDDTQTEQHMADNKEADSALFSYIGDFVNLIAKSDGFDFCVWFLGDKDKEIITQIWTGLEQFEYPDIEQIKSSYQIA